MAIQTLETHCNRPKVAEVSSQSPVLRLHWQSKVRRRSKRQAAGRWRRRRSPMRPSTQLALPGGDGRG
eukprot:470300-Pyramimonas_sp.AAC.1